MQVSTSVFFCLFRTFLRFSASIRLFVSFLQRIAAEMSIAEKAVWPKTVSVPRPLLVHLEAGESPNAALAAALRFFAERNYPFDALPHLRPFRLPEHTLLSLEGENQAQILDLLPRAPPADKDGPALLARLLAWYAVPKKSPVFAAS